MKKSYIVLLSVCILFFIFLFFRFYLGGPEDTWICEKSGWVKHGQPNSSAPISGCGQSKKVVCLENTPENCPDSCVVCPPCPACSSISCQTEEFCQGMGFDKNWYSGMQKKVTNFNECVASGNPVMESYPRQCRANGENFVEGIGNELEKTDLIRLDNPRPNQEITSPLAIKGQARGTWFFEGSFPVVLVNWDGLIIAEGQAKASSDWMTEDFVPFTAELSFVKPDYKNNGSLILQKDNPSGLPANDDALEIPIIFK